MPTTRGRALSLGFAIAVSYGIVVYLVGASPDWTAAFSNVTVAFLTLVPLGLGALSVSRAESLLIRDRILVPLVSGATVLLTCWVAGWEPITCIVVAAPLVVLCALGGGLAAGAIADPKYRRDFVTFAALAPIAIVPAESFIGTAEHAYQTSEQIIVAAPPLVVWEQIVSVDSIRDRERPGAWYRRAGFPAPVAVALERSRLHAPRRATFEGALTLTERVTIWIEDKRLSYIVLADSADTLRSALDDHLRPGRRVLAIQGGSYELESIGDTATRLTLATDYSIRTHLRGYANLWAGAVIRAIQREILAVVRRRAERAHASRAPLLTAEMREVESELIARVLSLAAVGRMSSMVQEAAILRAFGGVDFVGGGMLPPTTGPSAAETGLRNLLRANATSARVAAWLLTDGQGNVRIELEDRRGRCIAVTRTFVTARDSSLGVGEPRIKSCEQRIMPDAIARGRRLAHIPFMTRAFNNILADAGEREGAVDVYLDSVVVTVEGGLLLNRRDDGLGQPVDSVTATLGIPRGATWALGKLSHSIPVGFDSLNLGPRRIPQFRFTIPREPNESLTERWIVFQQHLRVPRTRENPSGIAWNYTHLPTGMFRD